MKNKELRPDALKCKTVSLPLARWAYNKPIDKIKLV